VRKWKPMRIRDTPFSFAASVKRANERDTGAASAHVPGFELM
jgi:hypothetical protein